MKKIGIVGTGDTVSIGHYHALGIKNDERATLSAVYNRSFQRSERFVSERNLFAVPCKSFDELLGLVDAVIICTPNDSHFEYASKAIEKGKSVLLEKPVANTLEEAQKLAKMPLESGQVVFMGFIYRYSNLFNELKRRVEEELGRVYTFSVNYGGKRLCNETVPIEWRFLKETGGSGAVGDYVSHIIDLADYTAKIRIEKIKALDNIFIKERPKGIFGKTEVENADSAVICGKGEKGELFSVCTSRLGMEDMRACVSGQGGMIVVSDREPTKLMLYKREYGESLVSKPKIIDVLPQEPFVDRFLLQAKDFISAISGEFDGYADLEQGLYVQKILDKIERSCEED